MAYALEFVGLIGRKCVPILIATSNLLVTNKLCLIQRITSYELLNIKSGKWKRLKLPYVSLIFLQSVKIYGKTKPTLVVLSYYYVFFFQFLKHTELLKQKRKGSHFWLKMHVFMYFYKVNNFNYFLFVLWFNLTFLFDHYMSTLTAAHSTFFVLSLKSLSISVGSGELKKLQTSLEMAKYDARRFFFFFFYKSTFELTDA